MSDRIGALYIRVSTDDQAELSPDAQKRLLLDYAKKNGIIISNDFIFSESVSGRHVQKRPEFQRMIGIAKQPSHPIDSLQVHLSLYSCPFLQIYQTYISPSYLQFSIGDNLSPIQSLFSHISFK